MTKPARQRSVPDAGSPAAGHATASGASAATPAVDPGDIGRFVRVRGAREHNLRDVDVDIPRDALVVFTGVSGSGKSSLAFGTIFGESQRRYLDSVAPYARRLIDQAGVPDVDRIDGLPPAVALQQSRGHPSSRSSVGSMTTLSSLLRLLFSRAGHYPAHQPMLYAEDFSPNTPQGACPHCHGLGRVFDVTEASMVPDPTLTIRERAIAAWPTAWQGQNLRDILVTLGYDVDKPWQDLPKKDRDWILFTDEHPSVPVYAGFTPAETRQALRRKLEPSYQGTFTGARRYVLHTYATSQSELMKKRVARFMVGGVCPVCHGKRLKAEALSVTFEGHDIGEVSAMPLAAVQALMAGVAAGRFSAGAGAPGTFTAAQSRAARGARAAKGQASHAAAPDVRRTPELSQEKRLAAQRLAKEMDERIQTLMELGLGYLTMDRTTPTLSPGELQRLRLGVQIRSSLFGVVYVLDEPSAGLHPADGEALLAALEQLRRNGNSVFVVEHDVEAMRRADWIVDVGPGAGSEGGEVLYSGPPAGLAQVQRSVTGRFLRSDAPASPGRDRTPAGWLVLEGVSRNNLQDLDVRIPLGVLCAVTGRSGSGKSTLAGQVLAQLLAQRLGRDPEPDEEPDAGADVSGSPLSGRLGAGADAVRRLVQVDQKPIGRTPRSNLATYTGLFDAVRQLFATTPLARRRRYGAGRFSFNVAKGRCETCEGEGSVSVELLFMPSVYAPCPTCHGARYNADTLAVTWKGRNIAEVLDMTVDAAREFFDDEPRVAAPLKLLGEIGLGYLRLGQPATELSGGEAQRIKLATELQRVPRGGTLYILDEPTTGLHPADVERLMGPLQRLVDAGNTVLVVEHEMRVVAAADWVIDMGPGAGAEGGRIVAQGTPTQVAAVSQSATAPYLHRALGLRP
ncbi:MAG: excinuclease ABC subunit UvrA [Rhodocyclaceae bacterium]|nr:excinuclease ABC subunit UvrA [Pseudomonadota bacterium]MDQ7972807.1 excinuclease ABC subunit UvrA [Rhodocyclaceae bacterium]MDQ7999179.1 excinuclease ABC subunit UvrA [Pseudomonadota bacterium]MDQ8017122.1 excinuclease ABC subunit UvrA [Pseudomonadota bacterium]